DTVRHAGGRMAWRMHNLYGQHTDVEGFAIAKQPVELAAVAENIVQVKHWTENPLYVANMLTDSDRRTCTSFEVRRCAQVIRMRMGFKNPCNLQFTRMDGGQHAISRGGGSLAAAVVVIQHRINDGGLAGGWVRN